MPSAFIRDGYTIDGYIAARDGLFDAVEFTYRPMTRREVARLSADVAKSTDEEAAEVAAIKLVAKKLVSWSVKDHRDEIVPISEENVLRLQPIVAGIMTDIVRGARASDKRPQQADEPQPHDPDAAAGN